MTTPVYLDWNASAPLGEPARAAMAHALAVAGNPSSVHAAGRAARRLVEESRAAIASAVGAGQARIVFTSGGTEANSLALNGFAPADCLVSAVEHDSVWEPLSGARVVPVDRNGIVDLSALEALLAERPKLVAVMLANNETGAIQPVAEIARLVRAAGARLHCDAVQALGKIALDFEALGADTLSLSAHKIGGPQGVGALVVRETVQVNPLLAGGGQEQGLRAGTQNVAGIAGFGAAANAISPMPADLRDALESAVRSAHINAVIHSGAVQRLPNTSCIGLPGVSAETQVMSLDLAGFAVSAGAACSSGKVKASRTLAAMDAETGAGEAIRVSSGPTTTRDEIDAFARAWAALARRLAPAGAKVPAAA